jgi:hypothetical protein
MNHPRDDRPSLPVSVSTPVVLHIMPKAGSSAPIGYIYDPDPSRDGGEGGLLAAAAAFFTHQGHEVFRDSCPDLEAYRRAGRITSTIVDVDRLPDHILSAGLDLLASFPPSSAGDTLGMSFMTKYLPVPPPPAVSHVDPVPLSPSFLGGSGGSIHSFRPAAQLCVPRGGICNSIPSLKNTPHHALAVSSHHLNMGGTLAPVAASLLCPSLPPWGMGGDMTAAVVRLHHILTVRLVAIHRDPLPFPRCIHPLLSKEDLIHRTLTQRAARILCSGAAPPPTWR